MGESWPHPWLIVTILAAACSGAPVRPPAQGPVRSGRCRRNAVPRVVRIRVRSLPSSLVPYEAGRPEHWAMLVPWVYEPLLEADEQGRLTGRLAASWQQRPGPETGTVWLRIRLRPKATWSDGRAVTARDAARTILALAGKSTTWFAPRFASVVVPEKVRVADWKVLDLLVDRHEVERLLWALTELPILPASPAGQAGGPGTWLRARLQPPGSGPYRVLSWTGNRLTLAARRRCSPGPQLVEYEAVPNLGEALSGVAKGRFQVLLDLWTSEWPRVRRWVRKHPRRARITVSPGSGFAFLVAWNWEGSKPRARRLLLEGLSARTIATRPWARRPRFLDLGRAPELRHASLSSRSTARTPRAAGPIIGALFLPEGLQALTGPLLESLVHPRSSRNRLSLRVVVLPRSSYVSILSREKTAWRYVAGPLLRETAVAAAVAELPCVRARMDPQRLMAVVKMLTGYKEAVASLRAYVASRAPLQARDARFWGELRRAGLVRPLYRPRPYALVAREIRTVAWRGCWLDLSSLGSRGMQ